MLLVRRGILAFIPPKSLHFCDWQREKSDRWNHSRLKLDLFTLSENPTILVPTELDLSWIMEETIDALWLSASISTENALHPSYQLLLQNIQTNLNLVLIYLLTAMRGAKGNILVRIIAVITLLFKLTVMYWKLMSWKHIMNSCNLACAPFKTSTTAFLVLQLPLL